MKMNPNYNDFDEVCSQTNFDMTVDALAKLAVQEEGGTLTDQVQNVTNYIWNLPNPYKFVYDLVKENHPKYQQSTDEQREPSGSTARREAPKAPGSVATVAGGSSSKNEGWTAAKIEALDELELDKVPAAVYTKYMQGDLK